MTERLITHTRSFFFHRSKVHVNECEDMNERGGNTSIESFLFHLAVGTPAGRGRGGGV